MRNNFYCSTGTDQDIRCYGLKGLLSKVNFYIDNKETKLMRIGLFFELCKSNFKFFYSRGMT